MTPMSGSLVKGLWERTNLGRPIHYFMKMKKTTFTDGGKTVVYLKAISGWMDGLDPTRKLVLQKSTLWF